MNTVDALNVLGKALCGDSFEVKPGLTDAETILEIAKNYSGGGSGGSDGGESDGGGGSSAPRFLDVYKMSNSSVNPGELDPLQDPSTWDISDWDFTDSYYLGENLTAEDIASMIPCYIYEEDGVRTIDTCGAESDLLDKGAAFCGLKVQPFDKHINVIVYFGEDGSTLEMGAYFPEAGYIVNPNSLIPIPDPDPDSNDPLG